MTVANESVLKGWRGFVILSFIFDRVRTTKDAKVQEGKTRAPGFPALPTN